MKKAAFIAAAATFVLATSATQLEAQEPVGLFIDGYVGYVAPVGDFKDATKASVGFGGSIGYYVTPAIPIFGTIGIAKMKAAEDDLLGLEYDFNSYLLNIGFDVMAAAPTMSLILYAGGGGMHIKPDIQGAERKLNFGVDAGAKFYLWLGQSVGVTVGASVSNAFYKPSEGDSQSLTTIPLVGGLAVRF